MRVVFVVTPQGSGWLVRRGATAPLRYETHERAIAAAERFARAAAEAGDQAMVRVFRDGAAQDHLSFMPHKAPSTAKAAVTGPGVEGSSDPSRLALDEPLSWTRRR